MGRGVKMLLAAAFVAGLVLAGFAAFLGGEGIAGHTWDWGVPNFAEQFTAMADNHFSTWDAYFETGRYHYFKLELLYWQLITPFSGLGGEVMSKALPYVFVTASGLAMLPLARFFGLGWFYAALASAFYALSPYTFSRVVAGHMPMLAGYAVIPVLLLGFFSLVRGLRVRGRLSAAWVIGCGLLLGLTSMHPSVGVGSVALLGLGWLYFVITGPHRGKLTLGLAMVFGFALLMNIHFMAPFLGDYLGQGAIRHGWGLSASAKGEVTVDTELPMREGFHQSTSQPLDATLLLDLRPGMDTEYAFPAPPGMRAAWVAASCALALLALCSFAAKGRVPETGALYLAGVVGVVLVCGSRTPFGQLLYQGLLKTFVPILFAAFSNTTRWLPIIVTAYALLIFQLPQAHEDKGGRYRWPLRLVMLAVLLVFVSPYLGQMLPAKAAKDKTPQPLAVKFTPIHPEDAKVYAFLRDQRCAMRVSYLPPVGVSWPGDSAYSYEWTSAYSPKPFFLAFYNNPLGSEIMKSMFSAQPSAQLAALFGLAAVKYLVYPHYDFFISYENFQPGYQAAPVVDGFQNYKPVLDRTLALQEGFELDKRFATVDLYYNTQALPLVTAADQLLAVADASGQGGNVAAAVLPQVVSLPAYRQGQALVAAGEDPEFLALLQRVLGPGQERFFVADRRAKPQALVFMGQQVAPPGLEFKRLGPTACRVRLTGVRQGFPLLFLETFHPGWKAYLVPLPDEPEPLTAELIKAYRVFPGNERDQATPQELGRYVEEGFVTTLGLGAPKTRHTLEYGPGGRVTGRTAQEFAVDFVSRRTLTSLQNDNLPDVPPRFTWTEGAFEPKGADKPGFDPLSPASWTARGADKGLALPWPELLHWQADGFANLWWIDPALGQALGAESGRYVRTNPAGGVDMELVIEFRPQRFYQMGLAVSAATAASGLAALAVLGALGLARRGRADG